ncbi:DUF4410 domain-containing protein [Granulicella arctica]|uniref:DUF4412 domain-containing protein n=1 Tax=Granulicella arctica TaxID=940613 RepID=A0A7Y9PHY3_9BACT|nr:DUF4410 domain-containing protein [Granulicella arctica]NYF80227.1 hypothetical protein [Granulicella arctica]
MRLLSGTSLFLALHAIFLLPLPLVAASTQSNVNDSSAPSIPAVWQSTKAEHVYGLPDIKHNKKGTLVLSPDSLTFTGKSGSTSIPRTSITAVSAGNQRVEIGGVGLMIFRMTIPDGGGLAAAAVLHHRQDMLTVEFNDSRGGNHAAVFFLPATEADHALQSFALTPLPPRKAQDTSCQSALIDPKSVLVATPNWDQAQVPAAYRALIYEHLIDRLRNTKEVAHVYRVGEDNGEKGCSQYTVHIAITTFKEGSSVKRAFLGPAGMFMGTTQMKFDVTFTDASGKLNTSKQIAATMRGESESTNVADHVAKNVAKQYANMLKGAEKSIAANKPASPLA